MTALNSKNLLELIPDLDEQIAIDWLIIRKAKRLPLTLTGLRSIQREAAKANLTPAQAIQKSVEEGWCGFKADWIKQKQQSARPVYDNDWLKTQEGIDKKAKELGVNINKCANYKEATDLIFNHIRSIKK